MGSLGDDINEYGDDLGRARPPIDPGHAMVGYVETDTTGWKDAGVFYRVRINLVGGKEDEGGFASIVDAHRTILAANLGTRVPPQGTMVYVFAVPNRYVFIYSG